LQAIRIGNKTVSLAKRSTDTDFCVQVNRFDCGLAGPAMLVDNGELQPNYISAMRCRLSDHRIYISRIIAI
jgi:hypothetical protein